MLIPLAGYAVCMFGLAMWIMLRDRQRRVNYYMVLSGCTLIVLATAVGRDDFDSHAIS